MYLGLGSNDGDRHANLLKAYKGLREVCYARASRPVDCCRMFMEDSRMYGSQGRKVFNNVPVCT